MSARLCLYYSRTGNTRAAAEKVAELLEAELVELTDGKARGGILGFLASGLDAMRKTPQELLPFQTEQPLGTYDHVIVATPVWAGRCSSIVHAFLAAYGRELPQKVSYIVTHMGVSSYNEVCTQMDQYLAAPHQFALSLQPKAADYHQKLYDFVRAVSGEEAETQL